MKGTGALVDTAAHRARLPYTDRLAGVSSSALPDAFTLEALHPERRNQGETPTCVGFGVITAATIFERQMRPSAPLGSALALFSFAKEHDGQDITNTFEGTYSTGAWEVVQQLGVLRESAWPLLLSGDEPIDPEWYRAPTLGALEGLGVRFKPHRLPATADAARRWLGGVQRPFSFVMPVDENYKRLGAGEVWNGPTGDAEPHCQCAVGFDSRGLRVLGSWSSGFADNGISLVSYSALEKYALDLIGPDLAP